MMNVTAIGDPIQRAIDRLQAQKTDAVPPLAKTDLDALLDVAPLARAVAHAAEVLPRLQELERENAALRDQSLQRLVEVGKAFHRPRTPAPEAPQGPVSIRVDRDGEGRMTVITATTDDGDTCALRVQRDGTGKIAMLLEAEEPVLYVVRDQFGRIASVETRRPGR
jgi:hypothetical protein